MTLGSACAVVKPESVPAGERRPVPTGVEAFDNLYRGLPLGSLAVIYGDLKAGKTTMTMNIAEHAALEEKRPVLYVIQDFSARPCLARSRAPARE